MLRKSMFRFDLDIENGQNRIQVPVQVNTRSYIGCQCRSLTRILKNKN